MKQRMIKAMFNKILKGPARDDMIIRSKKSHKTITVFHWRRKGALYHIQLSDYDNNISKLIAENFKTWTEAFDWLANYVIDTDF